MNGSPRGTRWSRRVHPHHYLDTKRRRRCGAAPVGRSAGRPVPAGRRLFEAGSACRPCPLAGGIARSVLTRRLPRRHGPSCSGASGTAVVQLAVEASHAARKRRPARRSGSMHGGGAGRSGGRPAHILWGICACVAVSASPRRAPRTFAIALTYPPDCSSACDPAACARPRTRDDAVAIRYRPRSRPRQRATGRPRRRPAVVVDAVAVDVVARASCRPRGAAGAGPSTTVRTCRRRRRRR